MTLVERWEILEACTHPLEVAQVMRYAGVKGFPLRPCCCPVAKYLASSDDCEHAYVSSAIVRVESGVTTREVKTRSWSPAVHRFINDFDSGRYSDLDISPN